MEHKEYSIKVKSEIINSSGDVEPMVLYAQATFYDKENKSYLVYDETELTGMEGTKTVLIYVDETVVIKRFGTVNSELKIEKQVAQENLYKTPYGLFTMITKGNKIKWGTNPLEIVIDYDLEIIGNNEVTRVIIEIIENV